MDRDMRDEVGADPDPRPASRHGYTERLGDPLLAAVLDRVQRIADDTVEWRAPI
jgi:hypothetical protein